ncbi:MAG: ArsR family transcriptional regulator [Thermomicrobiales bacterium]
MNELVEHLDLSQPAVSKHLKVLREAGLVEVRHSRTPSGAGTPASRTT